MPPKEISRVYEATVRFILTGSRRAIANAIDGCGVDITITSQANVGISVIDIKNLTQVKEQIDPSKDPRQMKLFAG